MFGYTLIKEKDKMQIEYDFEKLQTEEGTIKYCKKHLNEFCPEREV